jgi:phosphoribosyl-ATP pyrophosphohydrolase/phosphoribosyl-AMP cyclohydrolase
MNNLLDNLDFDKQDGLIPVVVQDSSSKEVLMLAYTNKQTLDLCISTGYMHYFSRSKNRIWKKGEESGHTQKIVTLTSDCDNDTILAVVQQKGVACHTGTKTCFFNDIQTNQKTQEPKVDITNAYGVITQLYNNIQMKKNDDPAKSYTAKLMQGEVNSLVKKVVEEAGEFSFAIKDKDEKEAIYEASDLAYHCLVALASLDISPDKIEQELKRRFSIGGIQEKNSRTK